MSRRKGQQALEYLITYGWALIVVLVAIGAFAYFGVLNPQKYIPERCDFGLQLECADYLLTSDGASQGTIQIKFLNSFGRDIRILDVNVPDGSGIFSIDPSGSYFVIDAGAVNNTHSAVLDLTGTDYALQIGTKTTIPLRINFSRNDPSATTHVVYGEIFASAQEI